MTVSVTLTAVAGYILSFFVPSSRNETLKKALQGIVSPSLDYEESLFMSQVRSLSLNMFYTVAHYFVTCSAPDLIS